MLCDSLYHVCGQLIGRGRAAGSVNDCQDDSQGDREDRPYNTRGPLTQPQGDREGRPYNTRGPLPQPQGDREGIDSRK